MTPVPESEWPKAQPRIKRIAVWRSNKYLAQVYEEPGDMLRISMCRVQVDGAGRWQDGMSWDEIQQVKHDIRLGDRWAVEIYPADLDVVNVANMRHLWVFKTAPTYGWHYGQ